MLDIPPENTTIFFFYPSDVPTNRHDESFDGFF